MRFSQIPGNEVLKASLVQMVKSNRLSHAIIFGEAGNYGAFAMALALAQYVNCRDASDNDSCGLCPSCHKYEKLIHPDLHFVFPIGKSVKLSKTESEKPVSDYLLPFFVELASKKPYFTENELYDAIGLENKNTNISVNDARRLIEKLSLTVSEGKYKVVIIYLPEKMNREAANALLKLIEEPTPGTLILMVSHTPEKLLTTIRSRCQLLTLKPLTREQKVKAGIESGDYSEYIQSLSAIIEAGLAKRPIDLFPEWEDLASLSREKAKDFCNFSENFIRKIHLVSLKLDGIADLSESDESLVRDFAGRIKPAFYEKAFKYFENAMTMIDSNVNSKLIFCDLCNRLLLSL